MNIAGLSLILLIPGLQGTTINFTDEALFFGSLPNRTTYTFDGFAPGTLITNQLAGISLVGTDGHNGSTQAQIGSIASIPFPMSPSTHSGDRFLSSEFADPIFATAGLTFNLSTANNGFGFWVTDGGPLDGPVINLFNGATLVGTATFGPQTVPASFVGVISNLEFNRVTVDSANDFDSWGLDNLTIGTAIPEPSTVGFVAAALAVLTVRVKR
jgi:hypothetical protein